MDVSLLAPWASLIVCVIGGVVSLVKMRRELDVLSVKLDNLESRMDTADAKRDEDAKKLDSIMATLNEGFRTISERLTKLETLADRR